MQIDTPIRLIEMMPESLETVFLWVVVSCENHEGGRLAEKDLAVITHRWNVTGATATLNTRKITKTIKLLNWWTT